LRLGASAPLRYENLLSHYDYLLGEFTVLLGEPARTQADINFPLLGIQVRVSPFFWLAGLILCMRGTGGDPKLVLMFIVAMFLSILIHEFGHALAFRKYGIGSHIVLYHFGGLAVPDGAYPGASHGRSLDSRAQIFVSAAGPAAQLMGAFVLTAILKAGGFSVPLSIPLLPMNNPVSTFLISGAQLPNQALLSFVYFFLLVSIYWAILNLAPLYPLDGGQISRELFVMKDPRGGIINSLKLSVGAGALLAIYGLSQGSVLMGIMFGMLAYSSYQMLMQYSGRGGGMNPW
jgi:stage IV sporulation protein FB